MRTFIQAGGLHGDVKIFKSFRRFSADRIIGIWTIGRETGTEELGRKTSSNTVVRNNREMIIVSLDHSNETDTTAGRPA